MFRLGLALARAVLALSVLTTVAFGKTGAVPAELLEKARAEGNVRVIVHLDVPTTPEGYLVNAAVTNQRATIQDAQESVLAGCAGTTFRVVSRFETIPFIAMEVGIDALFALENSQLISGIAEDRSELVTLSQSTSIVEATEAWASGFDGSGWTIAVLDTGVDRSHPFLSNKVVAEACFSTNSSCPNGTSRQFGTGSGAPCTYDTEGCEHGTHVAGIVAGSGSSFSGVAKGASIIAMQVFSRTTGSICGQQPVCATTAISDQIAAMEHVFSLRGTHNIAAVNMSLGGSTKYTTRIACDQANAARKAAMDTLLSGNIATIVASGNSGWFDGLSAPACISTAISVGSTNKSDAISQFSNSAAYGPDFLAPGETITSSVPGGGTKGVQGTSQATPHVSGAWAILRQKSPNASIAQLYNSLATAGRYVQDVNGLSYPRIRIKQALDSLGGGTTQPTFSITMTQSTYTNGQTVTASEFRLKNAGAQTPVNVRVWLTVPGVGDVTLISIGSDGSFQLPGNVDVNLGPLSLFTVTSGFPPKGSWGFNSRITHPTTGVLLSEDLNPFTVQ